MQHYCEISTPKGIMRGFFHQPDKKEFPVCIIFHGFTGQKTGTKFSYVQLSRLLEARGIATLRLDFLGSGESDLNFNDMTFKDELACARVILEEVLKMEAATKVMLLGHSMGGAIASELAKLYPDKIEKMCLWAPAYNLPEALDYLVGKIPANKDGNYDHDGYVISQEFVDDMLSRDLYQGLDIYKNKLLMIHGTKDTTVPFVISERYLRECSDGFDFVAIEDANHNFDKVEDIKRVLKLSLDFLSK